MFLDPPPGQTNQDTGIHPGRCTTGYRLRVSELTEKKVVEYRYKVACTYTISTQFLITPSSPGDPATDINLLMSIDFNFIMHT